MKLLGFIIKMICIHGKYMGLMGSLKIDLKIQVIL